MFLGLTKFLQQVFATTNVYNESKSVEMPSSYNHSRCQTFLLTAVLPSGTHYKLPITVTNLFLFFSSSSKPIRSLRYQTSDTLIVES